MLDLRRRRPRPADAGLFSSPRGLPSALLSRCGGGGRRTARSGRDDGEDGSAPTELRVSTNCLSISGKRTLGLAARCAGRAGATFPARRLPRAAPPEAPPGSDTAPPTPLSPAGFSRYVHSARAARMAVTHATVITSLFARRVGLVGDRRGTPPKQQQGRVVAAPHARGFERYFIMRFPQILKKVAGGKNEFDMVFTVGPSWRNSSVGECGKDRGVDPFWIGRRAAPRPRRIT